MPDKIQKTVLYYLVKKSMIKFVDDEVLYNVAEAVALPISIKKGDVVNVVIVDDKVMSIDKAKETNVALPAKENSNKVEQSVEQVKKEPESAVEDNKEKKDNKEKEEEVVRAVESKKRTLTVACVRKDKTALKTTDGDWPKISDELIKQDPFKLGLFAKAVVDVIMEGETIVSVVAIKEDDSKVEAEVKKDEPKKTYSSNSTSVSIEKQCALKASAEIIKSLIEKGLLDDKEKIQAFILLLSKTCYQAINEL